MDWFQAVILALVQGVTEFLPISSSAHLILVPQVTGWEDQGLAFDVAVHFGTLCAVVFYFRADIWRIATAWLGSLRPGAGINGDARLGWAVIVGTVPVVLAGLVLMDFVAGTLRSPLVIALSTAIFGLALWWADRRQHAVRPLQSITLKMALLIGLAQVAALVPGSSRSGVTMTAGLLLGLDRETAARFSFLLAIPAISGAALLALVDLLGGTEPVPWSALGIGLVVSAVSAWACIRMFLAAIQNIGMLPFVIYRLVLAAVIIWVLV